MMDYESLKESNCENPIKILDMGQNIHFIASVTFGL